MSNLTFANVASDIQSTAKIPFDIDDFLSDHGVQLSSKVREVWSPPAPGDIDLQDVIVKLKGGEEGQQNGVCQLACDFLNRVEELPNLSSHAKDLLAEVEQAQCQVQEAIEIIQKSALQ